MNIENMVIEPIADANSSFFNVVCLLKTIATENNNNKSNPKFNIKTKSIYIFIIITNCIIKKI